MTTNIQFSPRFYGSYEGKLEIPGYKGPRPDCTVVQNLFSRSKTPPQDDQTNLYLELGKKNSHQYARIDREQLKSRLNLNDRDYMQIEEEKNLTLRSHILKTIIERKTLDNELFLLLSSPLHELKRKTKPLEVLSETEKLFAYKNISVNNLMDCLEHLVREFKKSPYENFFPLAKAVFNGLLTHPDRPSVNIRLDQLLREIYRYCKRNPEESFSKQFLELYDEIINKRKKLDTANLNFSISSIDNPEQTAALDFERSPGSSFKERIFPFFKTKETIFYELGLDDWETDGNKEEALERISTCIKNKSKILNLSSLNIKNPPPLKNCPFIKELNLSYNPISSLAPLKDLDHIEVLDLSHVPIAEDLLSDLSPLQSLEKLRLVKFISKQKNPEFFFKILKRDLWNCDRIEWLESGVEIKRFIQRLSNETLSSFQERKEKAFSFVMPESLSKLFKEIGDEKIDNLDLSEILTKKPTIKDWLDRIVGDANYKNLVIWKEHVDLRPKLAKETLDLLEYAQNNLDFYNEVFSPLIDLSLDECGDKTLYYFNELIKRKELREASKLPSLQAVSIFKKYYPNYLISELTKQSIRERVDLASPDKRSEVKRLLEKEEIEIELELLTRWKDKFSIPMAFSEGRYIGTERDLREDFNTRSLDFLESSLNIRANPENQDRFIKYLVSCPDWQKHILLKNPRIEKKFNIFLKERVNKLSELEERQTGDEALNFQDYEEQLLEIDEEFERKRMALFTSFTRKVLIRKRINTDPF